MTPDIVFEEGMEEHMLDVFGWSTDDEGWVVDEDGERVESFNGHELTVDELGGVVRVDEEAVPLRDHFSEICDYVEWEDDQ